MARAQGAPPAPCLGRGRVTHAVQQPLGHPFERAGGAGRARGFGKRRFLRTGFGRSQGQVGKSFFHLLMWKREEELGYSSCWRKEKFPLCRPRQPSDPSPVILIHPACTKELGVLHGIMEWSGWEGI